MPKRKPKVVDHYSPARRLHELKMMLNSTGGLTVYEISERLRTSVRTAIRYMRALERAVEPLYADSQDRKKVYRLRPNAKHETITLNAGQMLALFVCRRAFDFLDGTGIKEDLDDVFRQLEATLRRRDFGNVRHLARKVFDVNEAPHIYEGRIDDMNAITTALLRDERLRIRHTSVGSGRTRLVIEPYTLLIYKKGVYLVGYSHHHQALRTFALDGIRQSEWLKGERFAYPADYDPAKLTDGAFGLVAGRPQRVRVLFDPLVGRYVRRRRWHPSQRLRNTPAGIEMTMDVAPTFDLRGWGAQFRRQGDSARTGVTAEGGQRRAAKRCRPLFFIVSYYRYWRIIPALSAMKKASTATEPNDTSTSFRSAVIGLTDWINWLSIQHAGETVDAKRRKVAWSARGAWPVATSACRAVRRGHRDDR